MLGYWLGHYSQHFALSESQRTLILQTMLFFVWLAGGGAMFAAVEHRYGQHEEGEFFQWSFVNALTITTIGFGDLYPSSDVGRGLVFPYSVGGIIMLGLMVSSIAGFARELSSENVVKRHIKRTRARTIDRTVTTSLELKRTNTIQRNGFSSMSAPAPAVGNTRDRVVFADGVGGVDACRPSRRDTFGTVKKAGSWALRAPLLTPRKPKLILLKEEKDRFEAMRHIQRSTSRFKNWYALLLSVTAFGLLWCVGAVVFWQVEDTAHEMTYFKALYFAFVSLLTIGYGD
ncbi:putative Two pore domain potassium channel [Septoria linicola]|nr:putative Two pore domain potassium channel [Septoria linicola]